MTPDLEAIAQQLEQSGAHQVLREVVPVTARDQFSVRAGRPRVGSQSAEVA